MIGILPDTLGGHQGPAGSLRIACYGGLDKLTQIGGLSKRQVSQAKGVVVV